MSVEVEHRFDGDPAAPPVVLSNSLGAEMGMWDEQMPELAKRFRVLRYDARGHGHSPAPAGSYSIEDLARDVLTVLDRNEIERASFAGVSLGGMVGQWLAINAPGRIERLALCSTSAHLPPPENWADRAATVRSEGMRAVAEATVGRWLSPGFHERHPTRVEEIRQMLLRTDPESYAACCEAIAGHDLRAELGSIEAPTLVISAAGDPSMPPEHARLLADSIPGARLLALTEGQHLVNVERPGEVTPALVEHFG